MSTIISMISTISTYLGGARGPGARGRVCRGDRTRVHGGAHQQRRQGRGGGGRGSGGVSLSKYFHEPTLHQYLLPQNHVISSERREVTRDTCQTGTRATRSSWWRRLGTARGYTPSPRASRCVSTISTQYLRSICTISIQYLPPQGNLYHLGGTATLDGPRFGYIWCSFDLQEFHTRYTERWDTDTHIHTKSVEY